MDSQAKNFHSLSADVERTKVTVVVNDRSTETGSMLAHDDKMLLEMKPRIRALSFDRRHSLRLHTGIEARRGIRSRPASRMVDQFLLLGFGTPGKELQKSTW